MCVRRTSRRILVSFFCFFICNVVYCTTSEFAVKFVKAPLPFTSETSATFHFETCRDCNIQCKLDDELPTNCKTQEISYTNLTDGVHRLEVCINGSQGAGCANYNWTVDTIHPTAYIMAASPFTNAVNTSVEISFSEPCLGDGGFVCHSVNDCNIIVYGSGQVIPSTLQILEPNMKYSIVVGLADNSVYGRLILVMDKGFCTDSAGNRFARTINSSYILHFDRRSVVISLRTHIPEKLIQLNNRRRTVAATNKAKNLKIYLYFSVPVLNSSVQILSVFRTSIGSLLTLDGNSLGNRRFGFLVKNLSGFCVVTLSLEASTIISRQGTPVSPMDPFTFLFDPQMLSVRINTPNMRTREHLVPVVIRFLKPVFSFNSSSISVSGGHLQSFREITKTTYSVDIKAEDRVISVKIPENITIDVAGNKNMASNILEFSHYSIPIISYVSSTVVTVIFAMTSFVGGFLTVSTSSLHSLGTLSEPASSYLITDPSRNLWRIAFHIQVFALSKWLAISMPVEYYEFSRGLQWSIPYLSLPWETKNVHSFIVKSSIPLSAHSKILFKPDIGYYKGSQSINSEMDAFSNGSRLTAMEYRSFFESPSMKPLAELIIIPKNSNGWKPFARNMFWLVLMFSGLLLLHLLILFTLKLRSNSVSHKNYGALAFPRFEMYLILFALPCMCQASTVLIEEGSTGGIVAGILLFGISSCLLLSLFLFLTIGITMGKFLHYKEVCLEGQNVYWYHKISRVILGTHRQGQWTWKKDPNSSLLTILGPFFEDLRGPLKNTLPEKAKGDSTSNLEGETRHVKPSFIHEILSTLRIYYTLLEVIKRTVLGVASGLCSMKISSKIPTIILLSITSFQLFFLLKRPFIKKRIQIVEMLSVTSELGIFLVIIILLDNFVPGSTQKKVGNFMVTLFLVSFLAQMVNEWYGLYGRVLKLSSDGKSFLDGLKAACVGFLLIMIPWKLLNLDEHVLTRTAEREPEPPAFEENQRSSSRTFGSRNRPWSKQLRELAKSSFTKDTSQAATTSLSTRSRSRSETLSESRKLHKDLEDIFSSK